MRDRTAGGPSKRKHVGRAWDALLQGDRALWRSDRVKGSNQRGSGTKPPGNGCGSRRPRRGQCRGMMPAAARLRALS